MQANIREFDALLAHNAIESIRELRTVKSDSQEMKADLISQMLMKGHYDLPEIKNRGFTKQVIDALITFLNH